MLLAGSATGFLLLFFGMFSCFFAGCQRETEDGQAGTLGRN